MPLEQLVVCQDWHFQYRYEIRTGPDGWSLIRIDKKTGEEQLKYGPTWE